jgi:hypothetical protein
VGGGVDRGPGRAWGERSWRELRAAARRGAAGVQACGAHVHGVEAVGAVVVHLQQAATGGGEGREGANFGEEGDQFLRRETR